MPAFFQEFIDVWTAWINASTPIHEQMLWGHTVLFWGRVGKVMELIGAFFLIYEILGREESSEQATGFAEQMSARSMWKEFWAASADMDKAGYLRRNWRILLLLFIVFLLVVLFNKPTDFGTFIYLVFVTYIGIGLFSLAIVLLLIFFGWGASVYAWLSAKEPRLRIVNLFVLAVGIMFDLLAS
jgi:hypothetical protein